MTHPARVWPVAISAIMVSAALLIAYASEPPARWSWQEPQAKVVPTGDLAWTPHPFHFEPGQSPRYIDFESGSDGNTGATKEVPWKHHPWDPAATGQAKACKGAHTYVFKQGVVYRGEMDANESGTPAAPIVLTRDPSWGSGKAVICGSEVVSGWKQGADNLLIPEPEKVWYADLDWAPRNVWMVDKDGVVTRIKLARSPNWNMSDPDDIKSQWWTWKNPDKPFDNYTTINGQRRHLAFDPEQINTNRSQDYYQDAIVWTTKGWVMGNPFPARVLGVDRDKGSLVFAGQWGGEPSYKIIRGCQYYLEDKPQYLDSPGEFWFAKQGTGGRLYLRLPGDQDPNRVRVEVARRIHLIDSRGISHVRIRGLTFRFANVYWNLVAAPYWVSQESLDVQPGCVRLLGSGTDIEVSHCAFEHAHKGVRLKAMGREDAIDQVVVADNVFSDLDSGGVELADSTTYGDVAPPMGRLYDVKVLRNKFDHIGLRPDLFSQGTALEVEYAQTAEVAGNFFDRICAQGIDVHGAKASGAATDRPFSRILIHHNKAVDTLINVDDFGGIETWQGGPAYVYDNISGNPGGYRSWDHELNPNSENRFGHAYYLDGAFKNYHFNNIAWGKSKGPAGKLANTAAFQEIISYQNTFFNNTVFNFVTGSRRQEPQGGRVKFLGNIWQGIGLRVFRDADPARTAAEGKAAEAKPPQKEYALDTDAYADNIFFDPGETFGVFEPSGRWHRTLQDFRNALQSYQPLAAEVGIIAAQPPVREPAAHDFRPAVNSAARGHGAKVFVPWSLYETVGEWNFCPMAADPKRILDEHWCMSPYYTSRDDYYKQPTYPLKGVNISLKDYEAGPLENWTTGALHFNGKDQYATLANEDICRAVTLEAKGGNESLKRTISGAELSSPQIHTSNFLLELFFKTVSGNVSATLIQKMNEVGWALELNEAGGVTLAAKSAGQVVTLASRNAVNDGQWHHVLAEADRKMGSFKIYIDGKQDATGPGIGPNASLTNEGDLYVGGTPEGHYLNGAIDFLRIARGTLAESKTTIAELYAWEFNGPFLQDFTGHRRPADGGYAGALDEASFEADHLPDPGPRQIRQVAASSLQPLPFDEEAKKGRSSDARRSQGPGAGQPLKLIRGGVVRIKTVPELKAALEAANRSKSAATLLLEDGAYVLDIPALEIQCPGLVIRSANGNRETVLVRGPDEGPNAAVKDVFLVSANDVVLADLSLGYCRYHGVQVRGEPPFHVSGLRVHNCHLLNCNQQFIKGSSSEDDPLGATDGCIEQCFFEFTSGWAYQSYTGGIDIHKGVNWIVRDNLFRNLRVRAGQEGIAEHAIHFWKRCSTRPQNIVVERNWVVNCDRGIGFGLSNAAGGLQGGKSVIRNNMVFNDGTGTHTDVGIGLESASEVDVDNNTVEVEKYWAPIEYRFGGSSNLWLRNNLVNRPIQRRDNAPPAVQLTNLEHVEPSWFRNPVDGDLRLTAAAKPVIDGGTALKDFNDDVDGHPRPHGRGWDIGASEF